MGLEIANIANASLNSIAKKADRDNDGKLSGEEYQFFAQEASNQGFDYKTIGDTLDMNAFERWWFDVDKVSTDGKDDGNLSIGEKLEYGAKGLFGGIAKGLLKHPVASALGIAAGVGLTVLTGGAALPALAVLGVGLGGFSIVKNSLAASEAKTDAEAKAAYEGIGTGVATVALSVSGVKAANKAGAKAGVESLQGLENASYMKNLGAAFKSMPEALKVSGSNIKANTLTYMSALKGDNVIYQNSNKMRQFPEYEFEYYEPTHPEAGRFTQKYTVVPEGTKIKTANGVSTVGKDEVLYRSTFGNRYYIHKPQYGADYRGSLKIDGGLAHEDTGFLIKNGEAVIKQQQIENAAAELAHAQNLDQRLAEYGIEFVGRQPKGQSVFFEDIVLKFNGENRILKLDGFMSTSDISMKEHILEALSNGRTVESIF